MSERENVTRRGARACSSCCVSFASGFRDQRGSSDESTLRLTSSDESELAQPITPLQTKVWAADGSAHASSDESMMSHTSSDESAPSVFLPLRHPLEPSSTNISRRDRVCPPARPMGVCWVKGLALSLSTLSSVGVPRSVSIIQSQQTLSPSEQCTIDRSEAPNEREGPPWRVFAIYL